MNSILSLSYNDLPPNLKTCLLYLCIYPEDYVIERDILVRRWIGEGFISEERGQSKQEVAENHFYELINKSMVQPVEVGYDGKARACKVHDMMLELLISKSVENNFISLASHSQTDLAKCDGFIRRLSVQHIDLELASILANEELSHVRSLTVMASTCIKHLPGLVRFEALRVLEFQDCQNLHEYDMNGIDKLFLLKYLSFRGTDMLKLPSGVLRLYDLETLDLRNTHIEELPTGIIQLVKLQHLLTGRYPYSGTAHGKTKIPNGIGTMKNLQVISGFNIIKSSLCAVEELGNLTVLKDLIVQLDGGGSVEYRRHEEMLLSSLCKLGTCKLQSVRIYSNDSTSLQFLDSWSPLPYNLQIFQVTTDYYFPMPKWIVPALTSLAYLDLNLIEVTEEGLRILGEMPALLYLSIAVKTVQKERLTMKEFAFSCLKEFYIIFAYHWVCAIYLTFEEGALPKLEKLKLPFYVSVAEAYGFCLGLGHLPCLRDAEITLSNSYDTYYDGNSDAARIREKYFVAATAIRNEANNHPNHPRLSIRDEMGESWSKEEEM
ncbi:hypothetical protein ACQJBY_057206 [Aegilops geniculata]